MNVCPLWVLWVLPVIGLCDELITRPQESYRLRCVVVCDLRNFVNEEAMAHWELSRQKQNKKPIFSSHCTKILRFPKIKCKSLAVKF
jgi:hypothetical protein